MKRPARKWNHLVQKLAQKQSQAEGGKVGKRAKRWRKAVEAYKAVAEQGSVAEQG